MSASSCTIPFRKGPSGSYLMDENDGKPLYDLGFSLLPESIPRTMVTHIEVYQNLAIPLTVIFPAIFLLYFGRTKDFVCLLVLSSTASVAKGFAQVYVLCSLFSNAAQKWTSRKAGKMSVITESRDSFFARSISCHYTHGNTPNTGTERGLFGG